MKRSTVAIIAAIAIVDGAAKAHAQTPASPASVASYRARILGVFDSQTGEPLESVEVADVLSGMKALTTKTGTVSLVFLPDGGSLVRLRKVGYEPLTQMIAISPADTSPITATLVATVPTLPAAVTNDSAPRYISPALRGFEERRSKGFGHFLTEKDLRKQDNKKMTDVVRQLAGVRISCAPSPYRCFAVTTHTQNKYAILGGSCAVSIYIDGVPASDSDLEKMSVNEYAGLEYYASAASLPIQYNKTGSNCGVMLLWTRER